ncbi:hypothetical protein FKM82_000322 [Ascaphus truei]
MIVLMYTETSHKLINQTYTMQHYNTKQTAFCHVKGVFYYNSNKNIAYVHFSACKFYECFHLFNLVQNIENILARYIVTC